MQTFAASLDFGDGKQVSRNRHGVPYSDFDPGAVAKEDRDNKTLAKATCLIYGNLPELANTFRLAKDGVKFKAFGVIIDTLELWKASDNEAGRRVQCWLVYLTWEVCEILSRAALTHIDFYVHHLLGIPYSRAHEDTVSRVWHSRGSVGLVPELGIGTELVAENPSDRLHAVV